MCVYMHKIWSRRLMQNREYNQILYTGPSEFMAVRGKTGIIPMICCCNIIKRKMVQSKQGCRIHFCIEEMSLILNG